MRAPVLPMPVRTLNWAGRQLHRLGIPLGRLDETRLLAAARARTGLEDFGGETFKLGLRRLIESWESEAALSTLGRIIARRQIVDLLVNRLEVAHVHRQNAEIERGKIEQPIFVVGMPRTGTSILHELLAQDPANRTPLSWEVDRPCPPPTTDTYETDPRIAAVESKLAQTDRLIPEFKKMHPMGARLPQECVAITAQEFASLLFSTTHHIPGYTRWLLLEADLRPAYRWHRRVLQLLQWQCPGDRWVLKSPGHLWSLAALVQEYPDARLVQTHRDPIKILASLTSLSVTLRAMASEAVQPAQTAREWSSYLPLALDRSVAARENGTVRPEQVIDIQFGELMADPIKTVRKIYEKFDLELTAEAEQRMRRFLAANPSDKHGKHVYRFSATGLDLRAERRKAQRYMDFFGVLPEEEL